jgi:hypothetical protein
MTRAEKKGHSNFYRSLNFDKSYHELSLEVSKHDQYNCQKHGITPPAHCLSAIEQQELRADVEEFMLAFAQKSPVPNPPLEATDTIQVEVEAPSPVGSNPPLEATTDTIQVEVEAPSPVQVQAPSAHQFTMKCPVPSTRKLTF